MSSLNTHSKTYIVLAAYTIILQLFLNIDSFFYATCNHYDSSVFFMCGKAMMNGLTPYTDFADSKGPLLWLIFGTGYLIDHYSYIGVFAMSCISYWITLCIAYQTSALFLKHKQATLAAMAMAVIYFYWNFYAETKAENFCMPFISYTLYIFLKIFHKHKASIGNYTLLGICVTACLLMKWSVAIMMTSMLTSMAILTYQQNQLKQYIKGLALGISLMLLPFAIGFMIWNNWNDFINEYFANTLKSVSVPLAETINSYISEWALLFTTKRFMYILMALPLLALWNKRIWFCSALPFLCAMFFIALSIRHDNFGHYITVVIPFSIVGVSLLITQLQKLKYGRTLLIAGITAGICYIIAGRIYYSDTWFGKQSAQEQETSFQRIGYYMAQVPCPTILNIGQEAGFAMGYTLPYCRYWITQMGMTPTMRKAQIQSWKEGEADFVVLHGKNVVAEYETGTIRMGYRHIGNYGETRIYCKKKLQALPADFHVSACDILFKRNVLNHIRQQSLTANK